MGDITIPREVEPLVTHIYNRLPWNFTLGDGQTTYVQNYNILDINDDGAIDSVDALYRYPQGHGDAWGHYVRALRYYYDLLRHPVFTWSNQSEAVNVNGRAVAVNYQHERAFAELAAKTGRYGLRNLDGGHLSERLGRRSRKRFGRGTRDTDDVTALGACPNGVAARARALISIVVVANSVIPATDSETPEHQGTIERVDRTTTVDLNNPGRGRFPLLQDLRWIEADRGANPLGLDNDVVSFAIDGNVNWKTGMTHYRTDSGQSGPRPSRTGR